jgi:hypothetical protein
VIASRRWQDWATTVIGALVALSPLVFTKTWTEPEAWTAYIVGGLIFVVGALNLLFEESITYLEGLQALAAVALFIAPWFIGFAAVTGMAWAAWIGAVALIVVLATLVGVERPTLARTT